MEDKKEYKDLPSEKYLETRKRVNEKYDEHHMVYTIHTRCRPQDIWLTVGRLLSIIRQQILGFSPRITIQYNLSDKDYSRQEEEAG